MRHIAFIDLTKASDLVSEKGLFKILALIGCPPRLLSIIKSFHNGMLSTVQYDSETSPEFGVKSGVKQGCILASTLFGIFFAMLFRHAFKGATEGVYLHSISDGKLFKISRLKAKSKTRTVLIRDMLFADDAALAAHSEGQLEYLMNRFYNACDLFSLTISLKNTQVMCLGTAILPAISVKNPAAWGCQPVYLP